MSYIGSTPTSQNFTSGTEYFNGDGSTTAFTLTRTVNSVNDIDVVINNVVQQPNTAYTISGTTITFTSAPSAGTANIYVRYLSTTTQSITPSQNSVGPSQINTAYALWNLSGSTINYTAGNVGIGTSSPTDTNGFGKALDVQGSTGAAVYVGASGDRATYGYASGELHIRNPSASGTTRFYMNGTERMRIDSSGNLKFDSGYGSVATAYGCRAWVNFNGIGTVAIRGSGNVSSITDNATGKYTVNFTNSMPDANYAVSAILNGVDGTGSGAFSAGGGLWGANTREVSSVRVEFYYNGWVDSALCDVAIFR